MKKLISLFAIIICFSFSGMNANAVPLTGTLNIPGDYPTLAAAITDLNTQGVGAGGVTLNLLAGNPQSVTAGGYVIGGAGSLVLTTTNASDQVIIEGNGNTVTASNTLTVGLLTDAIFKLIGADYITIQNFVMQENAANIINTPAASNNMTEWGVSLLYVTLTDGSQNNKIQNNTISLNRNYRNTFGVYSNTRHSSTAIATSAEVTAASGSNSGNKVYGNIISNVNYGIVFIGAGTTIAAIDNGNDIGGTSASTGNTITNWGGGAALSGYISLTGSNYCIFNNQQINDNVSYNTIVSAALTTTVTTGGFLKNYSIATPVGATTSTINNNSVTVTNNPGSATAGSVIGLNNQGLTPLNVSATISMNNNTVQNCVLGGSTSTTNGMTCMTNLSLPGTMNMTGNTILNNAITATTATTGILAGITNSGAAGTVNMNSNIIRSMSSTSASGQMQGIVNSGAFVTALNMNNNQLGNSTSGFFSSSVASSGSLFGLVSSGGALGSTLTIDGNDIRGINYSVAASSTQNYIQNAAANPTTNIVNNTFTNITLNSTGSVTFISNSVTHPAGTTHNVNNNSIVTAFNKTLGGGGIVFYNSFALSPGTVTEINTGNNFSNLTFTGTTTIAGWRSADGTTPGSRKTITNNTFSNITGGTGDISSILYVGFSDNTFASNNVSGNTISNITSAGNIIGFLSDGQNQNFFNNTINSMSSTGAAAAVTAISYTGATVQNCYNNKIYSLQSNGATATVNGILISSGTTFNVYNNTIGNLNAPSTSSANDAVRGISITSTTTTSNINLTYNTIYIPAQVSSGVNFSSSAVFHTANATSTTANLNMINNVLYNLATPNGTGTSVSFRRSSGAAGTLANYGATSNYNLFYAGTPGASNLIYNDGTSTAQTLPDYKNGVFTAGTVAPRDNYSYSGILDFTSVTDLSPVISNPNCWLLNGNGIAISTIGGDILLNGRSTTIAGGGTDIGAYEFTPSVAPPTVSSGPLLSPLASTTFEIGTATVAAVNVTGGSVSNVDFQYYSGTVPPGLPGSPPVTDGYGNVYWNFVPTGSGFTYTLTIHYSPALLGTITPESAIKVAIEDPPNNGLGLYTPYPQGTGDGQSNVDLVNHNITVTGLTAMGKFIITDATSALPVELASFISAVNGRNVTLNWATSSEENNSGFDVERSSVNGSWSKIGNVAGSGTTANGNSYSITDRNLASGNYNYRLKQIDFNGNFKYYNLSSEVVIGVPEKYDLSQNYPNPFNPSTKINYDIPFDGKVSLTVFDMSGKEIASLLNEVKTAGYYSINFNASSLSSGTYFYRINAEGNGQSFVSTKKMMLVK